MKKAEAGRRGEEFCAKHYEAHGYKILERNYHSRYGEIDVIAESADVLAFVEVKTRVEAPLVSGAEGVDENKRRRCMLTALDYLSKHEVQKQLRFDVFEVVHNGERLTKFRMTEDAYQFDEDELKKVFY